MCLSVDDSHRVRPVTTANLSQGSEIPTIGLYRVRAVPIGDWYALHFLFYRTAPIVRAVPMRMLFSESTFVTLGQSRVKFTRDHPILNVLLDQESFSEGTFFKGTSRTIGPARLQCFYSSAWGLLPQLHDWHIGCFYILAWTFNHRLAIVESCKVTLILQRNWKLEFFCLVQSVVFICH